MNRDLILSALGEISDPDFQAQVWSGNEPGVMSSFIECVEALFDDSGLSDALSSGVAYSKEIDRQIRVLETVLKKVDETQTVQALLSDPNLARARELARYIIPMLAS